VLKRSDWTLFLFQERLEKLETEKNKVLKSTSTQATAPEETQVDKGMFLLHQVDTTH
ncbi:unnamed protein product, partial [Oncorhynchus mykiss]